MPLKNSLTKDSIQAAQLPALFFDRVPFVNDTMHIYYREEIAVYNGTGKIDNPLAWRRVCHDDIKDVVEAVDDTDEYGYIVYLTNDNGSYYTLVPSIFNGYSKTFIEEWIEPM